MAADPEAKPVAEPEDPEVLVERESRGRPRAVAAAAAAALLSTVGAITEGVALRDYPNNDSAALLHIDEHSTELVLAAVSTGLGAFALGYALVFLFGATKGRRPESPGFTRPLVMAGAVLLAVGGVAARVALGAQAHDFATSGSQTFQEARDAFRSPEVAVTGSLALAGSVALGFAIAMTAVHAMRAGLLTRFMGILGIITGVLLAVPIPLPLARPPFALYIWLGALGFLFAGRWPKGVPPAWERGEAVPWPSRQELRERVEGERGGPATEPGSEPATVDGPEPQAPPRKRKRKRRG